MLPDSRRLLVAALALVVTVVSTSVGCAEPEARRRPVEPPLPAEKYDPAFGAAPERARAIHALVRDRRLTAARTELPKLTRAARERQDQGEWAWGLVESAQIDSALFGPRQALHTLASEPWPEQPVSRTALALVKATFQAKLAAGSGAGRGDGAVAPDQQLSREDVLFSLQEAWSRRDELGREGASRLNALLESGTYPKGIRDTLRDLVSYQTAQLLVNHDLWTPEETAAVWGFDLAALANAEPASLAPSQPTDAGVHPLRRALAVLADLEAWHLSRGARDAALEARLERLRILREESGSDARRALVRDALQELVTRNRKVAWATEGFAELAEQLRADLPDAPARALELARQGERLAPSSPGAQRCRRLAWEITRPNFETSALPISAPGSPSLRITYRNLSTLHAYAYPSDLAKGAEVAERLALSGKFPTMGDVLQAGQHSLPSYGWTLSLPAAQDHREHTLAVTPPLRKPGFYWIALSPHWIFVNDWGYHQGGGVLLSDLNLQTRQDPEGKLIVTALSWSSGQPVAGAPVTMYQAKYPTREQRMTVRSVVPSDATRLPCVRLSGTTDSSGRVTFALSKDMVGPNLVVAHSGEQWAFAESDTSPLTRQPRPQWQERPRVIIATDRAIYRPGQTVYWKSFAVKGRAEQGNLGLTAGRKLAVSLKTSGDAAIASLSVTTNRHGTASGHFRLPTVGLRGRAWIETADGPPAAVRIEEYRRPTYSVSIDAPRKRSLVAPFVLTVKAAFTYGRPVSKGSVDWEVRREKALTPGTDGSWLVAAGKGALGPDGALSIPFDPRQDVAGAMGGGDRLYTVTAKVVSVSGETRTASRPFYLGSPAVAATLEAEAGFFEPGEPARFRAQLTDLDGQAMAGQGEWQILELRQPAAPAAIDPDLSPDPMFQTIRQRLQHDAQAELQAWPDGRAVRAGSVRHGADGWGDIDVGRLSLGAYRLRYASVDPFGKRFEASREFVVAGDRTPLALSAALFVDKTSASVGSSVRVLVVSGHPEQTVRLARYRENELVDERVLTPSRLGSPLELPITEADRGGFDLVLETVREHRELVTIKRVEVPWDKMLTVSLLGTRDVLAPKSRQAWSAMVAGRDGAPIPNAEILASMVDRSLDGLEPHRLPDFASEFPHRPAFHSMPNQRSVIGMFVDAGQDPWKPQPPAEQKLVPDQVRSDDSYTGDWGWLNSPIGAAAHGSMGGLHGAGRVAPRARLPGAEAPVESDLRRDFSETSFFFPHLVTDRNGKADFAFSVPDSVTGWNVDLLAVTPDLRSGTLRRELQSRRDLMVHLTVPRFLREGDAASLMVEIENTAARPLVGHLSLGVRDARNGRDLGTAFGLRTSPQRFHLQPGESTAFPLALRVPNAVGEVTFTASGRSGTLSDGEVRTLPILPSRLNLAEGRSATLSRPGRITLAFDGVPSDPGRTSKRLVLTVHSNPLTSLLSALPGLEARSDASTDELLGRLLTSTLAGRLLEQEPGLRHVAQKAARRKTLYRPLDFDANRSMLLEETPWWSGARGGGPGLQVLDPETARRVREEAIAELSSRQSEGGGFAWFPGATPSRATTARVLEDLVEVSRAGGPSVDPMLQKGLDLLQRMYREDPTYWQDNGEAAIRLAYVAASVSRPLRLAAHFEDATLQALLDSASARWQQAPPDLACKLALALHRAHRAAEAQRVWESVMDAVAGSPEQSLAPPFPIRGHQQLGMEGGAATVLRALLELHPSDPRAERLAERVALQMELTQQRSARGAIEAIVALAAYLRQQGMGVAPHGVRIDYSALEQNLPGPDGLTGRQQLVFKLRGPSAPGPLTVRQTARGTTLATATWHFETSRASSGSQWPGSGLTRSYFVLRGAGARRSWVPLQPGGPLRVGEEVLVRLEFKVPYTLGLVCLRDPRPAGLEPADVSSGHRWFGDMEGYQEVRDNRTSFFFDGLSEGPHLVSYRMRAAMPGTFHGAPATLEPQAAPEMQAYSSGSELCIQSDE